MKEKFDSATYLTVFIVSFVGFLIAFFLGVWVGSRVSLKNKPKKIIKSSNLNDDLIPAYEEVEDNSLFAHNQGAKNKSSSFIGKTKPDIKKKKSIPAVKQKKNKKENTLNTGKKKDLQYVKKNKKEKKLAVSSKEQRYMLQIGAFKRLKDANRLKLRFEKKGYSVFIVKEKGKKSVFYKVRIGTFYSKKIAYKVKRKLEREEKIKAWLVPIK